MIARLAGAGIVKLVTVLDRPGVDPLPFDSLIRLGRRAIAGQ